MAHPARLERAACGFEDCKCITEPALDAALKAKDTGLVKLTSGSFRSCMVSCGGFSERQNTPMMPTSVNPSSIHRLDCNSCSA